MLNLYNGSMTSNHRKLHFLLEAKLSTDEKVPRTGRVLRNKIFVIGFPPNCTEMNLEKFFSHFGSVREARIVKDDDGVTKGYAFITFAKENSVVHALEHREPLYFMDRKLSINPAIKKQHQPERRLSSSTSLDSPSDLSSTSNATSDTNVSTNTAVHPMMPMSIGPLPTGGMHHYYHPTSQPYFHLTIPPHPIFCMTSSGPIWHHYYSTSATYPPCPSNSNNTSGFQQTPNSTAHLTGGVYFHSMMRSAPYGSNSKNVSMCSSKENFEATPPLYIF